MKNKSVLSSIQQFLVWTTGLFLRRSNIHGPNIYLFIYLFFSKFKDVYEGI